MYSFTHFSFQLFEIGQRTNQNVRGELLHFKGYGFLPNEHSFVPKSENSPTTADDMR